MAGNAMKQRRQGSQLTICDLFDMAVEKYPHRTAIVFKNKKINYHDLGKQVNIIANHLHNIGVEPEVVVAAYLQPSIKAIISVLGILKTGGIYLPIEPNDPLARISYIMRDSNAQFVLTQGKLAPYYLHPKIKTINIDKLTNIKKTKQKK